MTTILISVIQPLVISLLLLLFLKYRFDVKSWTLIFKALIFGIVAAAVMIIFDLITELMGYDQLKNLKRSGFYSVAIIGFGAEVGKFIFLRYYFLRKKTFVGPLDGIIYSILISIGFTLLALPLFANGFFSKPIQPQFLYSYTIVNVAFAIVLGFFVGLGKLRKNRLIDSLTGLGAATFFHSFYYFVNLTTDTTIFTLYLIGLILLALLLAVKSTNLKEDEFITKL